MIIQLKPETPAETVRKVNTHHIAIRYLRIVKWIHNRTTTCVFSERCQKTLPFFRLIL